MHLSYFFIFIANLSFVVVLNSQARNDYVWILGYNPNIPEEYFGGVKLDFNNNVASPEYFNINCSASEPAVLSSNYGRLLTYSEGCRIYNSQNEIMQGGDSINFGEIWKKDCKYNYPGIQNKLLLPWPGDTSRAIIFHLKISDDLVTSNLLYSSMVFNQNHPLGIVTEKNKYLLNPGLTGALTATRHANGRDWWILLPQRNSNRYYSILFDNKGVAVIDSQSTGTTTIPGEWVSQAVFSPDGSKYVVFKPSKGLEIYDFDRCSGKLSNLFESGLFSNPDNIAGGVAISLNSRFLYVSDNLNLYQFDLMANDLLSSMVVIGSYDGYNNPFATTFHQMSLAPDGKIYMFSTNGVKSIHVINHPEIKGIDCNFVQHGMELPAFISYGSLNVPYFRLGPDDGNTCDTLGINNLPVADFRFEIDSINSFKVQFINLSYFKPSSFMWTFGNNLTSKNENPNPVEYSSVGSYKVCLNVQNNYGSNTFCRTISINDSVTSIQNYINNKIVNIYPNPFLDELHIINADAKSDYTFFIYSLLGAILYKYTLNEYDNRLNLSGLPKGMYIYCLRNKGIFLQSGKIVKSE